MNCWICDDPSVVYVDVLDMGWCRPCYDETYFRPPPIDLLREARKARPSG